MAQEVRTVLLLPRSIAVVEKRASMKILPAGTGQFLGAEGKEAFQEQLEDAKKQDSSGQKRVHGEVWWKVETGKAKLRADMGPPETE